ncbi:MAG: tetratricopeptide repeat protein, partial [Candidatus Omnitrophica bacterium]|nr:tetratricopeptide repeat protein [Candidatus Omnitrophota bacterium]
MDIVHKWSNDDLSAVQDSVDALAGVLPDATPQADSGWEEKRFNQVQFLHSTAEQALLGDPVSKMILDVEAIDFHYKRGEVQKAIDRLEPWISAYPTALHQTFTEDEKHWSLWAKYNYFGLFSLMGQAPVAESGFREIVETVPLSENPDLVTMSWFGLAQALNLQGRTSEAIAALETALDLDASEVEFIPEGVQNERSQPRLLGGKMPTDTRATVVNAYQRLLAESNSSGGAN